MSKKIMLLSLITVTTFGCKQLPPYPERLQGKFPLDIPVEAKTALDTAYQCLDKEMAFAKIEPMTITAVSIGNLTGQPGVTMGGKEMLVTALSKLSKISKVFSFQTYSQQEAALITLNNAHPNKDRFKSADYFVRGGITQINKQFWSGQTGIGLAIEDQLMDESSSSTASTVSVDLSVGEISTLASVPGVYSSNSLTIITKSGGAIDFDFLVKEYGLSWRLGASEAYSTDDAIRTLMELGTLELMGKLAQQKNPKINLPGCMKVAETAFLNAAKKSHKPQTRTTYDSMNSIARAGVE